MIKVTLSWHELKVAANYGCHRMIQDLSKGLKDAYGAERKDGWRLNIEGVGGEMAVAKLFGIYYSGNMGDLKADDVGQFQVRTSSYDNGDLILHPKDPDQRPFILVTGMAPTYCVHGWILAKDGKRPEWWKDPHGDSGRAKRPAFFVPQSALHDIELLRRTA